MSERHNPECSKNRCRACCGYGVVVDARGGPWYERCPGEADVRRRVAMLIDRVGNELHDTPPWKIRTRMRLRREGRRWMARYEELAR